MTWASDGIPGSDIALSPRFEGIKVVCSEYADVDPVERSQPGTVDASGVVIHAG